MQLLELTSTEAAFLTASSTAPDNLQTRLPRKLAVMLTARLRLPVRVMAQPSTALAGVDETLKWHPDAALATLWLTRRLGGQRVTGTASFVPPTLIHALDATLAECWLDAPAQAMLPEALALTITTGLTPAMLTVQLPCHPIDMTRWARGVIQHG